MIPVAIVAGGLGTRMRSVSEQIPKVMLPIGGRPLLEHQIRWLKAQGVEEATICLGYKAQTAIDHFGDGGKWGMKLTYQVESAPRGTAGAARDISPRPAGDLLVVYGDLYVDMDLKKLLAFHRAHAGAATLVCSATDHPYDSDMIKAEGDLITGFLRPKPGDHFENIGAAAVWVVRPSLMDLVPADLPSDFGRDIFPRALAQGLKLYVYRTQERIEDVGTPDRRDAFLRRWDAR